MLHSGKSTKQFENNNIYLTKTTPALPLAAIKPLCDEDENGKLTREDQINFVLQLRENK